MDRQFDRTYYDRIYKDADHFNYKRWRFTPYMGALIRKFDIDREALILDLGCGTGLLTSILHRHGRRRIVGLDYSEVGIKAAYELYGDSDTYFVVGDANMLPFGKETFDLIFCRGLSLYSVDDLPSHTAISQQFILYLKKGGLLINCLSTDGSGIQNSSRRRLIGKQDKNWINHTLADIHSHFSSLESSHFVALYFVNRLDLLLLGRFGFNRLFSTINQFLSSLTGIRGEAVCVVKRT